ncbi:30S ribosomal protein S17 [Halomarina litorea]|uniref:30S ribosomal protein S17 n=1 Tax=Halomarina litorea TaxID=2961595 RepID=UPI0034A1A599
MAIGLNVPEPEETCSDPNCPFHGTLSVRGQLVEGRVASTSMDKTVVVEREYDVRVPKYDRLMKRRSRISAHHPDCLDLSEGDTVRIAETRPLSKTKSHVVVELVEEAEVSGGITAPSTEAAENTSGAVTEGASDDRSTEGEN